MNDYTRKPRKLVMVEASQQGKAAVMADFIEVAQKLSVVRAENDRLRELLRRALVVIGRAEPACLEVEIRKALDAT